VCFWWQLDHVGIIGLQDVFECGPGDVYEALCSGAQEEESKVEDATFNSSSTGTTGIVILVMELATGGELYEAIRDKVRAGAGCLVWCGTALTFLRSVNELITFRPLSWDWFGLFAARATWKKAL